MNKKSWLWLFTAVVIVGLACWILYLLRPPSVDAPQKAVSVSPVKEYPVLNQNVVRRQVSADEKKKPRRFIDQDEAPELEQAAVDTEGKPVRPVD